MSRPACIQISGAFKVRPPIQGDGREGVGQVFSLSGCPIPLSPANPWQRSHEVSAFGRAFSNAHAERRLASSAALRLTSSVATHTEARLCPLHVMPHPGCPRTCRPTLSFCLRVRVAGGGCLLPSNTGHFIMSGVKKLPSSFIMVNDANGRAGSNCTLYNPILSRASVHMRCCPSWPQRNSPMVVRPFWVSS